VRYERPSKAMQFHEARNQAMQFCAARNQAMQFCAARNQTNQWRHRNETVTGVKSAKPGVDYRPH